MFVFRNLFSSIFTALNMVLQSWPLLSLFFVLQFFLIPYCHCQTSSAQNIETFYPNESSAPNPTPQGPEPPPRSQPSPPTQEHAPAPVAASSSTLSKGKLATAIAVTAASTIVVCCILFILVQRCLRARRRKEINNNSTAPGGDSRVVPQENVFERVDGNVRGLIVDEDGLDVIYWRKLEGKSTNSKRGLHKEVLHSPKTKEKEEQEGEEEDDDHEGNQVKKSKSIQEIPLLRGKSSTSHINIFPEEDEPYRITRLPPNASAPTFPSASVGAVTNDGKKPKSSTQPSTPAPPISPSTPFFTSLPSIPKMNIPAPSPSPPSIPEKMGPAPPPPPPPKAGPLKSSSKPPSSHIEMPVTATSKQRNSSGKGMPETSNDQLKLKPLHWDKVNTSADHSMVWDKVDRGSFSVDQDLMVALFGYVATNRRSPKGKSQSMNPSKDGIASSTEIFLLDPRKSQNIAIVLKSLTGSQDEILNALYDGKGLNADIIEMLARVSPTEEEQSIVLKYKGDPARLATAESFLYHILKAVPSAFKRVSAMLFRLNYDSEILEIKESLQTIELGCKELKNQRLFMKLLEAVLKAGNRMNAGSARGNAQAFNLASLKKLSDVKSTNGKTSLLQFVVEEVVRSEGKRIVLNRNNSLSRSSSRSSNISANSENNPASNEQKDREYITLGLPIVGGISSEFTNLKKAAPIDYDSLVGSISALSTRIVEIQELVSQCGNGERGNFVKEMDHFLCRAKEELKFVRDEQTRVMQLIKITTEYYQGEASKNAAEHNLPLFVIVKDFLGMVDQACIEIARNLQKRKTHKASSG